MNDGSTSDESEYKGNAQPDHKSAQALQEHVLMLLNEIKRCFLPGMFVTLLVRDRTILERFMFLTEEASRDDLIGAIQNIKEFNPEKR